MSTPPSIKFSEFSVSGVSPVGQRHQLTHSSFVKRVSDAAGEFLDFGAVNTTFTKKTTKTKAVVAFADAFNDATEAIFNMRFWLPDISDFVQGSFNFNGFASGVWMSGLYLQGLNDASGVYIPTALPSGFNLRRQDGWPEISGFSLDSQTSEFIYLSVTLDTDVKVGVYGGDSGGFQARLSYDYR